MRHKEDVGEAVQVLRRALGMTIREMSAVAGIAPSYLSQVENNHKTPSPSWTNNLLVSIAQHERRKKAFEQSAA